MFFNLTLNSAAWLLIGLLSIGCGGYVGYRMRLFIFAFGLASFGFGCICCGLTNGFTDSSPRTHLLRKFGKLSLIGGLPITAYYAYLYIFLYGG